MTMQFPGVAVLIPCFNEAVAIGSVVREFRAALPGAQIYVFDNNSTDRTAEAARDAGANVRWERLQGKGNVVRRMFADIEAEVYVLVDGDGTYEAAAAPLMVARLLDEQLDMITGIRRESVREAYRPGHRTGNWLLTNLVLWMFDGRGTPDGARDLLSGYRVFSRRFVKSFPSLARGFEIETELTVHALEMRMPVAGVETAYRERPAGSASKLATFRDGFKVVGLIGQLVREERPLRFFSAASVFFAVTSLILVWPVFLTFRETGLVPRLPTAVLAMGLGILSCLSFACGLILETVTHGRRELKRLRYLELAAPSRNAAVTIQMSRGA
jgi:glycosyltransferase involved in cell wall biosynthesis